MDTPFARGPSTLIRVDRETLAVDTWPVVGGVHYGLTVDGVGDSSHA